MISAQLGPNSGPRPEELKDTHGYKVEGVSNLRWASNVEPMGQWPIKLQHPTLGKHMYYIGKDCIGPYCTVLHAAYTSSKSSD